MHWEIQYKCNHLRDEAGSCWSRCLIEEVKDFIIRSLSFSGLTFPLPFVPSRLLLLKWNVPALPWLQEKELS